MEASKSGQVWLGVLVFLTCASGTQNGGAVLATRYGDGVGWQCEIHCTRAVDSVERWAYGEQLKRKPEKW